MNIAFCYESVLPARGGCETYIADLARRLLAEGHQVHLYACRWDAKALPPGMHYHRVQVWNGIRFLRPWFFAAQCARALRQANHDVSIGFDKTWGQDILYPQGGLHLASSDHNLKKLGSPWQRGLAWLLKQVDPSYWSFALLERQQYCRQPLPTIVVNSFMVRRHFQQYYGIPADQLHVVRSAIDPGRFREQDRPRRRREWREKWDLATGDVVGLFAAMNYRLKGLDPLLLAVRKLVTTPAYQPASQQFRLLVAGNPAYQRHERLAQQLGIHKHVRFIGHCPEMRNAYFAADFLIHPTFYDPCSLVVLEALACSLPVITTRVNGASELLHPLQEGYVIDDPHDHAHLAWCISQLLDPGRRQSCALAARKAAARWTFDDHYRALLKVMQQAAARKQAA